MSQMIAKTVRTTADAIVNPLPETPIFAALVGAAEETPVRSLARPVVMLSVAVMSGPDLSLGGSALDELPDDRDRDDHDEQEDGRCRGGAEPVVGEADAGDELQ